MTWRHHRTVAVVALLTGMLVACTGSSGNSETSLRQVTGDGYSVGIPADWDRRDEGERLVEARELEFVPPSDVPDGVVPPQVGIVRGQDEGEGANRLDVYIGQVFDLNSALAEQSIDVESDESVEVEGATEAHRLDMTYTDERADGKPRVRMRVLLVRTDAGVIYDLRYVAPDAQFDPALANSLTDSFALAPHA